MAAVNRFIPQSVNEAKVASYTKTSPLPPIATVVTHARYNTAGIAVHATVIHTFHRAGKSLVPLKLFLSLAH